MRILCFGDSNTYGYDPRDGSWGRYPAENRWTDILAQKTGWAVRNRGENGRTIPCRPQQLEQTVRILRANCSADLIIVMLGTNDILQGAAAPETAARMEAFLTHIRPCCKKLLLIAPPPMTPCAWITEPRLLEESARLGAFYAEISRRMEILFADAALWNPEMAYDGVHLSEQGSSTFSDNLLLFLHQYFSLL